MLGNGFWCQTPCFWQSGIIWNNFQEPQILVPNSFFLIPKNLGFDWNQSQISSMFRNNVTVSLIEVILGLYSPSSLFLTFRSRWNPMFLAMGNQLGPFTGGCLELDVGGPEPLILDFWLGALHKWLGVPKTCVTFCEVLHSPMSPLHCHCHHHMTPPLPVYKLNKNSGGRLKSISMGGWIPSPPDPTTDKPVKCGPFWSKNKSQKVF